MKWRTPSLLVLGAKFSRILSKAVYKGLGLGWENGRKGLVVSIVNALFHADSANCEFVVGCISSALFHY